jgi:hypothetical protein
MAIDWPPGAFRQYRLVLCSAAVLDTLLDALALGLFAGTAIGAGLLVAGGERVVALFATAAAGAGLLMRIDRAKRQARRICPIFNMVMVTLFALPG